MQEIKLSRSELIILKRGLLQLEALPSSQDTGMNEEFHALKALISEGIKREDMKAIERNRQALEKGLKN